MAKKNTRPTPPRPSAPRVVPDPAPVLPRADALHRWVALGLALFAFVLYVNTLGHGYVLDDPLAMGGNALVKKGFAAWPELLTTHYRQGTEGASASALLYRPLSLMAFAAEWAIAPESPGLGHFMNVLWYALTTGMIFLALRRLFAGYHWIWAGLTALLFAAHPLHTEVVANIKSRDEIFSLFFGAAALYCFTRAQTEHWRWTAAGLGAYLLALLSKESAVTMWPLFGLSAWFFFGKNARQSLFSALPYAAPVALFFLLRAAAFSGIKGAMSIDMMDNPIVAASGIAERSATGFAVLWRYIQLLLWPNPLLCDYSYNHFPLVQWNHWSAWAGLVAVAAISALGIVGFLWRQAPGFCALAWLLSIGLYSQLATPIGTLFGERLAFVPSLWWCAGLAWVALLLAKVDFSARDRGLPARTLAPVGALGLLSLVFAAMTWLRNPDWRSNQTLFAADSAKAPNSVRLHNGLATESYVSWQKNAKTLSESEKNALLQTIEAESRKALAVKVNPVSLLNLGNAALVRQQYPEAIGHYEQALQVSPGFSYAVRGLAAACALQGRIEGQQNNNLPRAAELFRRAIELGQEGAEVHLDLGVALGMMGKNAEAIPSFERATQLDPGNSGAWRNLAQAYSANGQPDKAAVAMQKVK